MGGSTFRYILRLEKRGMALIIGGQGKITDCGLSLLCEKSFITPAHKDAFESHPLDKPELPLPRGVRNKDAVMHPVAQAGRGEAMAGMRGALSLSFCY